MAPSTYFKRTSSAKFQHSPRSYGALGIAFAVILSGCSRTSSEALCVPYTTMSSGVLHTRIACPFDVDLTVGAGGEGVAYAFIDGHGSGRELLRIDGFTPTVIEVSPAIARSELWSFATDDEGGVHLCAYPGRAVDPYRMIARDHGEYVAGSWRVENLVGPSPSQPCALSAGPGRYTLFGREGVVLRHDEDGQAEAFSLPIDRSSVQSRSAAFLDSRLVPRLVRARGGDGVVADVAVLSSLPDEPDVAAIRNFRSPEGVATARLPGLALPAIVVEGAEDGIVAAYPAGSGYVEVPVPNTSFGRRELCFRCVGSSCLDTCEKASGARLAAASGALWLAWIHDISNRSYSCVGSKYCGKTLEADLGHTELVLARVTESGVDVRKRLPVASQHTPFAAVGMRAIDQHLVIGVVTQSANLKVSPGGANEGLWRPRAEGEVSP